MVDEIRASGTEAWLDRQLQPLTIDDSDVERRLRRLRDLTRTPADFRSMGDLADQVTPDLRVAVLVRAVESNRHLLEVMTDLWHDHLVVSEIKPPVAWHLPSYDRDAIRPHALGRYADLLRAATTSGAMLEYLDTVASAVPELNENHGRELLELHTVGRAAGYTEEDVTGASRVLSGWTVEPERLSVVFDPSRHDARPARVLGWSTPGRSGARGERDLHSLLDYLAAHPATAERIATLLVRRFVADTAPPELVAKTAAVYLTSGTDISTTLRHLLSDPAFRTASAPIVRRPLDLLAAQLRATSATLEIPNTGERVLSQNDLGALGELLGLAETVDPLAEPVLRSALSDRPLAVSITTVLRQHGQSLFSALDPSGHPLGGPTWGSGAALLRRWTLGAAIAQNALPGIATDAAALARGSSTAGEAVDALFERCLPTPPSPQTRAAALVAIGLAEGAGVDDADMRRALAFVLAAPEMQIR